MTEHKISDEVMANTELLAKLALTDEEREKYFRFGPTGDSRYCAVIRPFFSSRSKSG